MKRQGILFVISGPSGVGKGTLREKLMMSYLDDLYYSISATTRKPRSGEVDGRDYFFTDEKRFLEMIERQELIEWAKVYNNYYGTPKEFVLNNLAQGKDVLLEIDINGAIQVKKMFPRAVFIFILPPDFETLKERLTRRGRDTNQEIQNRLACYDEEVSHLNDYDYMVLNDNIKDAVEKIKSIIMAERCKISRYNREVI